MVVKVLLFVFIWTLLLLCTDYGIQRNFDFGSRLFWTFYTNKMLYWYLKEEKHAVENWTLGIRQSTEYEFRVSSVWILRRVLPSPCGCRVCETEQFLWGQSSAESRSWLFCYSWLRCLLRHFYFLTGNSFSVPTCSEFHLNWNTQINK